MSEMIERVANAIWLTMDAVDKQDLETPLKYARAAIEAMREPTYAMERAAYEGKGHGDYLQAIPTWQTMIDEALK